MAHSTDSRCRVLWRTWRHYASRSSTFNPARNRRGHRGEGRAAGRVVEPGPGAFQRPGDAERHGVVVWPADDLDAGRQAGVGHARRHREHRAAAEHVEQRGHRHVGVGQRPAVDHDRVVLPVRGGNLGTRHGRADEDVEVAQDRPQSVVPEGPSASFAGMEQRSSSRIPGLVSRLGFPGRRKIIARSRGLRLAPLDPPSRGT